MAVDPIPSAPLPEPGARRPDPSRPAVPAAASAGVPKEPEDTGDRLALSAEAVRLATGADIPADTMSPERLAAVTRKLAEGAYDTAEARDTIARALREELGG